MLSQWTLCLEVTAEKRKSHVSKWHWWFFSVLLNQLTKLCFFFIHPSLCLLLAHSFCLSSWPVITRSTHTSCVLFSTCFKYFSAFFDIISNTTVCKLLTSIILHWLSPFDISDNYMIYCKSKSWRKRKKKRSDVKHTLWYWAWILSDTGSECRIINIRIERVIVFISLVRARSLLIENHVVVFFSAVLSASLCNGMNNNAKTL